MEEYKIMYGERESHVKSYRVVEQGPFDHDFGQVEVFGYFKNNDVFILRRTAFDYSFVISSINYNPELWMIEEPPEWDTIVPKRETKYVEIDNMYYTPHYGTIDEWQIIEFAETAFHRHYEREYTLFDVVTDSYQINDEYVASPFRREEE